MQPEGPVLWRMLASPVEFVYRNVQALTRGRKKRAHTEDFMMAAPRTIPSRQQVGRGDVGIRLTMQIEMGTRRQIYAPQTRRDPLKEN